VSGSLLSVRCLGFGFGLGSSLCFVWLGWSGVWSCGSFDVQMK